MDTTEKVAEEATILARFPRRSRVSGGPEELRITVGTFNGLLTTGIRVWFPVKGEWRPSKDGASLREHEIDQAIIALEVARQKIHEQGRETSPRTPLRYAQGQPPVLAGESRGPVKPGRAPRQPVTLLPGEDEDPLAEYRERRPR